MGIKNKILKELVRNGYSRSDGIKVWNISDRKFLYLTPGLAKGFLKFRKHDRYKTNVIDREVALMEKKKEQLCSFVGKESFNLIDVCCGDGSKVIELSKQISCKDGHVRYCPVNVSKYLVDVALKNVKKANINFISDFDSHTGEWDGKAVAALIGKLRDKKYKKNVVLLLGSVLASFDINDYLFHLSSGLRKGDYVLIGNGIRIGKRLVHLDSYKHKAFDDWFMNLMKEIGFKNGEVEYQARFGNSRIEAFYKVVIDKNLSSNGIKIGFKKGDEILVGILYKYYEKELANFCKMYFSEVELLKDEESEYALVICKK